MPEQIQATLTDLRFLYDSIATPVVRTVVFGEFNHGKSTLINALLGRELLVADLIPTTGHITEVVYAPEEQLALRNRDGSTRKVPLSRLAELSVLDEEGRVREDIEVLTVGTPSELLRDGLVLTDTPGTNEDARQTHRALKALQTADLVIWVLNADHCLSSGDRALAGNWFEQCRDVPLVPVMNFMNKVPSLRDKEKVRQRAELTLSRQFRAHLALTREFVPEGRAFFEVNADQALRGALSGPPSTESGFVKLQALLRQFARREKPSLPSRRAARLRVAVEKQREENRLRLEACREAGAKAKKARQAKVREAEREEQRLGESALHKLAAVESAAREAFSEREESLVRWLRGESVSSLREKTGRWFREHFSTAVNTVGAAASQSLAGLAVDYSLSTPQKLANDWYVASVSISFPTTSWWDDVCDLVNSNASDDYRNALAGEVRTKWRAQVASALSSLRTKWQGKADGLRERVQERRPAATAHGFEETAVHLKALELTIRRGSSTSREKVLEEATAELMKRAGAGEILTEDLLRAEVMEEAFRTVHSNLSSFN
ncbi:MAG TPA: dynamin family protein [Chthoniobacteraceae bacterium]|jgi:hypothetical protein|nr:dynamin family protein [Chthoniobacteraceae bacterium]